MDVSGSITDNDRRMHNRVITVPTCCVCEQAARRPKVRGNLTMCKKCAKAQGGGAQTVLRER